MSTDVLQLFLNSAGAVTVTGTFIYYLIKKDKRDDEKEKRFNVTLNGYLKDSVKVKKDLAEKLQRNTDVLENLEKLINGEFQKIIQKKIKEST